MATSPDYFVIQKDFYFKEDDTPFRVLKLLMWAGANVNIRRSSAGFEFISTKIGNSYIYIKIYYYHGWEYTVLVSNKELEFNSDIGYFDNDNLDLWKKYNNSEEFYDWFASEFDNF